jgi:hypothetical protein
MYVRELPPLTGRGRAACAGRDRNLNAAARLNRLARANRAETRPDSKGTDRIFKAGVDCGGTLRGENPST